MRRAGPAGRAYDGFRLFHKEIRMQVRRWMMALAAVAGLGVGASVSLADITGIVTFEGQAPEPEQIDMAAVKECAMQHPDGAFLWCVEFCLGRSEQRRMVGH